MMEGGGVVDKISFKNSNITSLTAHNIAEVEKEIDDGVTDKEPKGVINLVSFKFGEIISLILSLSTVFFSFCWQAATLRMARNTLLTFLCLHNKINNGQMDFASGRGDFVSVEGSSSAEV